MGGSHFQRWARLGAIASIIPVFTVLVSSAQPSSFSLNNTAGPPSSVPSAWQAGSFASEAPPASGVTSQARPQLPDDPAEEVRVSPWKRMLGIKKKPKPVPEDTIKEIGPRAYPAKQLPLFRLQKTIQLSPELTIPPGFYLVNLSPDQQFFMLQKENKTIATIPVANIATPPAEPVTRQKNAPPAAVKVSGVINESQSQLILQVDFNDQLLQSAPLTIVTDRRPVFYP